MGTYRRKMGRDFGTNSAEFADRCLEIVPLPFEPCKAGFDASGEMAGLLDLQRVGVVERQPFANLGQREAQSLAAQDQDQACSVPVTIDSILANATRLEQTAILVETERARRGFQLGRQLADGVKRLVHLHPISTSCV